MLLAHCRDARTRAQANIRPDANGGAHDHPSPRTRRDYFADDPGDKLRCEYELRYYVLNRAQFHPTFQPVAGYASFF